MSLDLLNSPVSDIAYRIWELNGKPNGRDIEFWKLAERIKSMADEAYMHDCDDLQWTCGGPNKCPYWHGDGIHGLGEYYILKRWFYTGMPV